MVINEEYRVEKYIDEYKEVWDQLINESSNGTFLQSMKFLSYHPKERFEDASFLVFDKKKHLIAVCPGCILDEDGEKFFFSHKGSTFGGVIVGKKHYSAKKYLEIMNVAEEYIKTLGCKKIYYKLTPQIFMRESEALMQYSLSYMGYKNYAELSLYIDYAKYNNDDVLREFSQGKRTDTNNCIKAGMELKVLDTDDQIEEFYALLCKNLEKYDAKPVHTVQELMDFKDVRLKEECEFYGVYHENRMVAGAMMFYFKNVNVAHTQYLCANEEYSRLSPMTFMYYNMILEMRKKGYEKLSWGGVTEDRGSYLNMGLCRSKEAYGSIYSNNWCFYKEI